MSLALRDKDFCLQKLDAAIALVESLTDNEFPHPDSRLALEPIARVYKADKELLLSLEEDARTIRSWVIAFAQMSISSGSRTFSG